MYHKHHIIPKHMGGTDDPSNLIELSVEEHAEAHRLLFEKYGRKEDWLAWQGLAGTIGKEELIHQKMILGGRNSWDKLTPEQRKIKLENFNKLKIGNKHALGKTWKLSEQSKKNVAESKSQEWYITHPNGKKEKIKNMFEFCRQNNLDQGAMSNVAKGKNKHHKNYRCEKVV
jgi:hypothetical protein